MAFIFVYYIRKKVDFFGLKIVYFKYKIRGI